jgi:hypothetical protein
MQKALERKSDFLSLIILLIGIIFILLCLSILALRISSVFRDSLYAQSTGAETPPLYGIYKVWTGRTLYEPLSVTATPMIYNYLFYYTYGYLAKIFVTNAESLPLFSRMVTLIVTLSFSVGLLFYIRNKTNKYLAHNLSYGQRSGLYFLALVVFIGPFIGWWNLTARPDLFGMGLELCAIILLLTAKKIYGFGRVIATTFIFWLAWSFKQNLILVYLGFLVILLIDRRYRQLFVSAIFFSLLCCLPLVWFGVPYAENIIRIPAVNPWKLEYALRVFSETLVAGAYFYLPVFFLLGRQLSRRFQPNANCRILLLIFVMTFVGGFVNSARWASGRNHYFAAYLVAGIFIVEYLISSWKNVDGNQIKFARYVCLCLYSIGLALGLLYLILPNRFGRISLLTRSQRETNKEIISVIRAAAKPVFVQNNYLALPWNCGQDYSDIVDDTTYIFSGITIVEQRIKNRYYAEAFLSEESRWKDLFEESGYKQTQRLSGLIRFKAGNTP